VLTPADEINHINKHNFKVPVLCGCRDLGEALRRIAEGSSMIRTKVGKYVQTVLPNKTVLPIKLNRSTYQMKPFYLSSETVLPIE
jgi:hypothetical protein